MGRKFKGFNFELNILFTSILSESQDTTILYKTNKNQHKQLIIKKIHCNHTNLRI